MAMAPIPLELWLDALNELIYIDQDWIPEDPGCSLYIRPFMFATDRFIGIRPTEFFKFIIITSPAGNYYTKPVKVIVSDHFVRAFAGGVGFAKAAGNYGATMLPLKEAQLKGFDQVLWTDGNEHKYAQEIGTMNVFFIIDGIAITPDLDGTILDGVTRDSVMQLLRSYGLNVEERKISMDEVEAAYEKGLLEDAFGTGTAASVAPISHIGYKGKMMGLLSVGKRTYCNKLKYDLEAIKRAQLPDPFSWIVKVKSKLVLEEV
jgi:branched-chain amino acid aminotransferase